MYHMEMLNKLSCVKYIVLGKKNCKIKSIHISLEFKLKWLILTCIHCTGATFFFKLQ